MRPGLTPLAAVGLVLMMSGAMVLTLAGGEVALALTPLVVGGAPLDVRRLRPLVHARSTGARVIATTQAHQHHERG
jgi:hypothetical protein